MVGDRSAALGLGAIIRHRDITQRMTMEQRLRRSENLFHLTTENARDLITILGTNGMVRYRSPSHRKALGLSEAELNATPLFDLIHPDDSAGFQGCLRQGARKGLTEMFEFRMRHRDGSYGLFEAQAAAVDTGGDEQEMVLLISRDITQRKAAEAERAQMEIQLRHAQKMEAVGQLAAGIAHEINTPIQFVGDNLRFLKDSFQDLLALAQAGVELPGHAAGAEDFSYLEEEIPRAIQQSVDGIERVSTIVKAMKIFTHPSREGLMAVDINQAIENTLIVSRNEWKYVCEVERKFTPALPEVVCSPGEFNQVILNIVVNAAHAIAERLERQPDLLGRIVIETRAEGAWAEIRVSDNGCGIPEQQLPQIWLPFFTTKPVGKGTGQGLSIVHSIVTRHRGTIQVASEPGRGTCFTLRLPLDPTPEQELP
jgi:PAS domain S-box-containing protein